MNIISFDVFDTLLTRVFAEPKDIFLVLGVELEKRGLIRISAKEFAGQRIKSELMARESVPQGEITLLEIYSELAQCLGWNLEQAKQAKQIELDFEANALRAVSGMIESVREARRTADQVLFLTDMYLPGDFIEAVLRREGFFEEGDRVFVSGELRRSKHSGQMFLKIKELFKDIVEWRHVGDNFNADVKMAQKAGIKATLDARCRLNRYECMARGKENLASDWQSKLAGAMRLARLENPEREDHRRVIWDTGCAVVGPLLFGFVHWCLETARQQKLRRIYFVARDGQILHRIANILATKWNYDVECRYLYGSRQAWHPAGIVHFSEEDLKWVLLPTKHLSLRQVFERLGLNPENHLSLLEKFDLPATSWEASLTPEARHKLKTVLLDSEIVNAVNNSSHKKRETLLSYLKQEGVLDGDRVALGDIGWHGNMQKSLENVLKTSTEGKGINFTGLYFGLLNQINGTPQANEIPNQIKSGYWNVFAANGDYLNRQNLALFEIFTAADHGSVMGFEQKNDRIVPQLAQDKNIRALNWGLATLQSSILRFSELYSANVAREAFEPADFYRTTRKMFDQFYTHPSAKEVAAWGSFEYSDGQIEASFEQPVPNWNKKQIISAIINRKRRPTYWWLEGTRVVCPCLPLSIFLILKNIKRWTSH